MKKFTNLWLIIGISLLAVGCAKPVNAPKKTDNSSASNYTTPLRVGQQQIFVEIATTDAAQEQGLSGRPPLSDQQGMLFDFSDQGSSRVGFWMKDMRFALDFIWINQGKIIGITPNVPAPANATSPLPVYYPPSIVDQVLEVNAGWAAAHAVKIGDEVRLGN